MTLKREKSKHEKKLHVFFLYRRCARREFGLARDFFSVLMCCHDSEVGSSLHSINVNALFFLLHFAHTKKRKVNGNCCCLISCMREFVCDLDFGVCVCARMTRSKLRTPFSLSLFLSLSFTSLLLPAFSLHLKFHFISFFFFQKCNPLLHLCLACSSLVLFY